MTGAEKLPDRLAAAFEEHFGVRPMEGYGCTECAPVVAVNTPDFRSAGFHQVGAKRGKIGHPLPGVCVRVVDVENPQGEKPLPLGRPGLLLVRGPNVMQGYLGRPEKTAEVLRDGWYVTGDVAALDEDGFLQITDRLNRFSKIGGEMVPHIKVEEKLHELAGATEQTFVVTVGRMKRKANGWWCCTSSRTGNCYRAWKSSRNVICRTCGSRAPTSFSAWKTSRCSAPASWICARSGKWVRNSLPPPKNRDWFDVNSRNECGRRGGSRRTST